MTDDCIKIELGGRLGRGKFTLISQSSWDLVSNTSVWLDTHGYACVTIDNKKHLLHRLILGVTDSKISVDHINGDPLDNRLSNLRTCTHAENMRNRGPNGSRRFKGVYRNGRGWQAQIKLNYKTICLGTYQTEEDAARAYDAAALQYHGAFACLNFPQQPATEATA